MKKLNHYITEAWSGVKRQSIKVEIEAWCDEMGIKNYTINSKDEIDVDGDVNLDRKDFKELPYKFGRIKGHFVLGKCNNLTSLKNCPDYVRYSLLCSYNPNLISLEGGPKEVGDNFFCNSCPKLNSLKGCPKEVGGSFYCYDCKRKFTIEEIKPLCKVKEKINI